jgi:uncharacterized membrane protein
MTISSWIVFAGIFTLLLPLTHAATISGTAYDGLTLEALKNVVISINTNPVQTKLAKEGTYSFDVGVGKYALKATYTEQGIVVQEALQPLTVEKEGNYVIDLILLPEIGDIPDEPFPDDEPLPGIWDQLVGGPLPLLALLGIVLVIVGYSILNVHRNTRTNAHAIKMDAATLDERGAEARAPENKTGEIMLDQYALETLHHLQRGGNRLTQKELRAMVNIGEAKVSLVVSELESYGLVKKIKKGRGNILILTEKGREYLNARGKGENPTFGA